MIDRRRASDSPADGFPASTLSLKDPAALLATWFGVGLLPRVPGTWGSLAALPFAWAIEAQFGRVGLAVAAVALAAAGTWAASACIRRLKAEDPQHVVVDEVAGQWLTLAAVPADPLLYGVGFALFRIADILKPWPVSWLQRHVEGGLGVILDDVAAAAYAGGILFAIARWLEG